MNQVVRTKKCFLYMLAFAFCRVGPSVSLASCDCTCTPQYEQNVGCSQSAVALDDCAVFGMGKDGTQVGTVHRINRSNAGFVPVAQFSLATTSVTFSEVTSFGYGSIQINRTGDTSSTASVGYRLAPGTALAGSDYTDYNSLYGDQIVEFQPAETTKIVHVPITQDTIAEPDESFSLYLWSPSVGAGLGNLTNVVITILDNDRPGPGKPDSMFVADIGSQYEGTVKAVARQSDGRIVVGGQFRTISGSNRPNVGRILADGSLDLSFNAGAGPNSDVLALAIQADGKIVIAGLFSTVNGVNRAGCARLDASGALDVDFAPPQLSFSPIYSAVALQPDGKVLVGGAYNTNLARLNTDGTLDTSFAVGGGVVWGGIGGIYALALQADGKVLAGGSFTAFNGSPVTHLVRLESNGSIDPTFTASVLGVQYQTGVYSIVPLPNGDIMVGGIFTNINGTVRTNVARLLTNGVVATAFAPALNFNGGVPAIAAQSDGKMLVGGGFNLPGAAQVARLNSDGSLDTGFDVGSGPNSTVHQVLLLPSGDILVGGGFPSFNELPTKRLALLHGAWSAPPAPAFLSFGPLAAQFRLVFSVANGSAYVLESSQDLTTWTGLRTGTSTGSDITFTDADTSSHPCRFYRIRLP